MNESLSKLTHIGFGHSSGVAPWVWRYAKQLMDRACALGLAKPYNFGRGKGKYTTDSKIEDVASAMQRDPEAIKIAARYHQTHLKKALDLITSDAGHYWDIKKDSVFLADLEHALQTRGIAYTIEPPRLGSDRFYVSIKRQEAIAV